MEIKVMTEDADFNSLLSGRFCNFYTKLRSFTGILAPPPVKEHGLCLGSPDPKKPIDGVLIFVRNEHLLAIQTSNFC